MQLPGLMNPDGIRDYISGLLPVTEILEAMRSGFGKNVRPVICGFRPKAYWLCGPSHLIHPTWGTTTFRRALPLPYQISSVFHFLKAALMS